MTGQAIEATEGDDFCHHSAMRKVLLYLPIVLSLVVLGAHFLRYGNAVGVSGSLLVIALLFVRQPWAARLTQVVLLLGALEWLRTLYELAQLRAALGQPFTRMVLILAIVAAVTFCSAFLFQLPALKRIYRLDGGASDGGSRSDRASRQRPCRDRRA